MYMGCDGPKGINRKVNYQSVLTKKERITCRSSHLSLLVASIDLLTMHLHSCIYIYEL